MTGFGQFANNICDAPQILRDNAGSFGPWAPLARAMVATIGFRFHGKNRSLARLPQAYSFAQVIDGFR
jgi:hypothetical protein